MSDFLRDPALSGVVIKAVDLTLETMFGVKPHSQRVKLPDVHAPIDVSGIMSLVEADISLTFVLSFSKETILELLSSFYGRSLNAIDDTVLQGVGELTNIVYGQLRNEISKSGQKIAMSLPSIILGEQHSIVTRHSQVTAVQFEISGHSFYVFLGIGAPST